MNNNRITYLLILLLICVISIHAFSQCSYTAVLGCGSTVTTFASGQTLTSVVCYTPTTFTTSTIAALQLGSGGSALSGTLIVSNANLTITSLTLDASWGANFLFQVVQL